MYSGQLSNPHRLETDCQVDSNFARAPAYVFGSHHGQGTAKFRHPPDASPGPGAYAPVGRNRLPTSVSYSLFTGQEYFPRTTASFTFSGVGDVSAESTFNDEGGSAGETETRQEDGFIKVTKEGAVSASSRQSSPMRSPVRSIKTSPRRSPRRQGTFGRSKMLPEKALRETYMSFSPGDDKGPLERFIKENPLGPGQYDTLDPLSSNFMTMEKGVKSWNQRNKTSPVPESHMAHNSWTLNVNTNQVKMNRTLKRTKDTKVSSIHSIPGTTILPLPTASRRRNDPIEPVPGPGYYAPNILMKKHKVPGPHISFGCKLPSMWTPSSHMDPLCVHLSYTDGTATTVPWHSTEVNFDTSKKPRTKPLKVTSGRIL